MPPVVKFLGNRIISIVISLSFIVAFSFAVLWGVPGNYTELMRAQYYASQVVDTTSKEYQQIIKEFEERYGLDKPRHMQIISFLGRAFTFTFGPGYRQPDVPLESIILNRLPTSLTLTFVSIGLATIVGLTLGSVAAFFRNTWIDYVVSGFSLVGQVIPVFVIAIFFKYLFAVQLKILPSLGWGEPRHAVLPVLAFSLGPMGGITRFMRASMVSSLSSNYVRTAYSKGLPRWRVVARHCIPNSLIPVVTIAAPQVATGLLGIVFIEQIFGIAGVGLLFGEGYNNRDYPQVVATIYVLSLAVMLANLVADILYSILDPRIRIED